MVMQRSAPSPSPNFYSVKSYVKKITVLTLRFRNCAKFPCKIEKSELEVVSVGILGREICFQGSH